MTSDNSQPEVQRSFHWPALILWVAPLAFPVIGFSYIVHKLLGKETIGPYSLVLLLVCLIWTAGTLAPLMIRRYRLRILSRPFHLFAFYLSLAAAVLIAEVLLTALDVSVGLRPCHPETPGWWSFFPDAPPLADYFIADSVQGSRFHYPDDPNFNRQGFRDRDEFTSDAPGRSRSLRILLLGDSFAYGSAAVNDGSNSGFADLIQDKLNDDFPVDAVVWNTGIPGTGQAEQLLHLKKYLPILKPQYVLLAFYEGNDLRDNVSPVGSFYVFEDGTWADRYGTGDPPELLTPRETWLRSQGYGVESNSFFLHFRTTSIVYRMSLKLKERFDRQSQQRQLEYRLSETGKILQQISGICRAEGVKLIVVLIPEKKTLEQNSDQSTYEKVLGLYRDLSIENLDLRPFLAPEDYVPAPDLHWNKTGHRKAAEAMLDRLRKQTGND